MIVVGGKEFVTLDDEIFVGGKKVLEVYAGNRLVYPTDSFLPFAFWFNISKIQSNYSPKIVNRYGAYIYFSNDLDYKNVYKVAWVVTNQNSVYPRRTFYLTFNNFRQAISPPVFVPFFSYDNKIIIDGLSTDAINTSPATLYNRNERIYYSTGLGADLTDAQGHYAYIYSYGRATSRCKILNSEEEAIEYVTS